MKLTTILCGVPKFHFWKDFGAGFKKKRYPHHKYWHAYWKRSILNAQIRDERLHPDQLPEGARIVQAKDLITIELPEQPKVELYNHPWPFNITQHPDELRPKVYYYNYNTRFYRPAKDALALTNTVMEPSLDVPSNPKLDLVEQELEMATKRYNWATREDLSLYRLPRKREFPRIDQTPKTKYGITKQRAELNVMAALDDFVGTLLAQRLHKEQARSELDQLISRKNISHPNCVVPLERDGSRINLHLSNDFVSLCKSPIPIMNKTPEVTLEQPPVSIHPRSWRSLMEETTRYFDDYQFKLPIDSHIHTLMLTSRIERDMAEYEMFARSLVHAYGSTIQMARLHESTSPFIGPSSLDRMLACEINNQEQLEKAICVQTIAFDLQTQSFHFSRFQLNSTNYNSGVKNQAWYSGPITSMEEVLRYWVDFHVYGAHDQSINSVRIREVN